MNKISILQQDLDYWTKFWFFNKISIFKQNFDFWTKFLFLSKISIFEQNFDFWSNFEFFRFLTKTCLVGLQNSRATDLACCVHSIAKNVDISTPQICPMEVQTQTHIFDQMENQETRSENGDQILTITKAKMEVYSDMTELILWPVLNKSQPGTENGHSGSSMSAAVKDDLNIR